MIAHMIFSGLAAWLVPAAQAHEKWFITPAIQAPKLPEEFRPGSGPFAFAVLVLAVVTAVGLSLDRRFERSALYARIETKLRTWRDYAPGVLAVSTGLFLLWSAWHGVLLADEYPLPAGSIGLALRLFEAAVGLAFLIGFGTASASIGLGLLWVSMFALSRSAGPFDYLYLLGTALFLFAFARGRYSLDWFFGKPILTTPERRKQAYFALRLLTGASFLVLASLKWYRPDVMFQLINKFADWNPLVLLRAAGLPISREIFVLCLAVAETLAGVFVFGGIFMRFTAIALMPVFLASVIFLGPLDIIGHLPILGILFVLFVYGDTYHKTWPPAPPASEPTA